MTDIHHLLHLIDTSPFWSALCSTLIVAILFSILYPIYLDYRKRPKVYFINTITRTNKFKLDKLDNGTWRADLPLSIKNEGRATLHSYYFHLLVPTALGARIEIDDKTSDHGQPSVYGPWRFFSGLLPTPLFPKRGITFPTRVTIWVSSKGQWSIYYWFATEFGIFPSKAHLLEKEQSKALSNIYLGELIITAED